MVNPVESPPPDAPKTQFDRRSEDDDFEETSQSLSDYAKTFVPSKPPHRSRKWLVIVIFVLLAGAAAAAYLLLKPEPVKPTAHSSAGHSSKPTTPDITTKAFSSTNFGLSFDYPSTWSVADATDGSQITARSPIMQLDAATGKNVSGQVVLSINHSGQNLGAFDAGNAVAVRESAKITYTKPTETQRADTYLSFLQYASTTIDGALDAVYVTGDFGYQLGQAIPKIDVQKADPLITVTFVSCQDDSCGKNTPLSVPASIWNDKTFVRSIETILKSLAVN